MMTAEEKTKILRKANDNLRAAGFDNVVILANEGGTDGDIRIAVRTNPALFRFLLATYFMDDCMSRMVTNDSRGKDLWDLWDPFCHSVLDSIVPEILKIENTMKD
jgi:hypothetical protein|nr:MAG TPA: hypothetical protein [Caudoviricetes sp.]